MLTLGAGLSKPSGAQDVDSPVGEGNGEVGGEDSG